MTAKTKPTETLIALVVTTEHRGVFFGWGTVTTEKTIRLTKARMCVSWTGSIRGVTGLAAVGPDSTCKVGLEVAAVTLQGVTGLFECSPEAVEAWEKQPWA